MLWCLCIEVTLQHDSTTAEAIKFIIHGSLACVNYHDSALFHVTVSEARRKRTSRKFAVFQFVEINHSKELDFDYIFKTDLTPCKVSDKTKF